MATGALLDFDRLIAPIDDAEPCGPNLRDEPEFRDIEDAPGDFGNQKAPELRQQVVNCDAFLARTKDQAPALVALQAAVRIGDFALANDALRLIKGFAELYWEDFHPGPADEMAIARINEISALARPAAMTLPLQRAPIAALPPPSMLGFTAAMIAQACEPTPEWSSEDESTLAGQVENGQVSATVARSVRPNREGARSLRMIMRILSSDARAADVAASVGGEDMGMDDATLHTLALNLRGQVEASREALSAMSDLLYEINEIYDRQVGDSASLGPVLTLLKTIVGDADRFLATFPADEAAAAGDEGTDAAVAGMPGVPGGAATAAAAPKAFVATVPQSRKDVVLALDAIRRFYADNEPGSPIPLILQRVQAWVDMNFMELMTEIAPQGLSEAKDLLELKTE